MAAFVSTDVTVALAQRDIIPLGMSKKMTFPSITFGDGAITYHATTKVPMPAVGNFGFRKAIERVFIEQPADGYIYHYDRTNNRIRIFLGAGRDAITMAAITAGTPAGNLFVPATNAVTAGTPAGNLFVPATNAVTAGTPAGNLASNVITFDPHSHGLVIANNATGAPVDMVGAVPANSSLTTDTANTTTIPGGLAANGGVANETQTGVVNALGLTMDAMATHVHAAPGNVAIVGDAMATHVHAAPGNVAIVGDALPTHTHVITGGGAVAEAALAEMDTGVAPAAVTLYTQMIGQ